MADDSPDDVSVRRAPTGMPVLRILALSAALLALAAAVLALPRTLEAPDVTGITHLPWWALAVLVGVCERIGLHIQVRREAHLVSLSELGIVLGLFLTDPVGFLIARSAGSLVVFVVCRRQHWLKIVFNASLYLAESAIALAVFHLALGPAESVGPRGWVAAAAATCAAALLSAVAVTGVIALVDREIRWPDLALEMARGAGTALGVTCIALVAVHALDDDPLAAIPLAVSVALLLLGWKAYSGLSERHLSLERLYRFSHVVSSTPEVDGIIDGVLQHAREVLRAERAQVVFVSSNPDQQPVLVDTDVAGGLIRREVPGPEADDPLWRRVVAGGSPMLLPRGTRDPAMRSFLAARGLRDAVLAPIRGEAGIVGTILVGDRMGEVRSFDEDDVHLLETVANHAGMALRNGQLLHRLRHDAMHDTLTGLPNRTALQRALQAAVASTRSGRSPGTTVMIMDLVGFKQVNDTFGHHLGDLLLVDVGNRMADVIGKTGVFARLGGDEFAAVLPGVADHDLALQRARAVQAALEEPVTIEGVDVEVGVSIGVACAPGHGLDGGQLMRRADAAMYEAKSEGTGPHVYTAGMDAEGSPERLALVAELRTGLTAGQLELHVQPQARVCDGEVVGVEALVRWRHPRHGLLYPDEFIPLAERSNLMRPLTVEVLAMALSATGHWWRAGHRLTTAVNLSARGSLTEDIVDTVESLLRRHGVPPDALTLEITETSIIRDPVRTRAVLDRLHRLGVRLSIDDFGTGYSSLSYLRQLPVQEVKVDKSFVGTMNHEAEDATIVRSIVDLAGNLGLAVVAEGVEDAVTWRDLAEMGCDLVQGYHLARPMPVTDLTGWLESRRAEDPITRPTAHRTA